MAEVHHRQSITVEQISNAIDEMGFETKIPKTEAVMIVNITGMTCKSCVNSIECNLLEKDGVILPKVSLYSKLSSINTRIYTQWCTPLCQN